VISTENIVENTPMARSRRSLDRPGAEPDHDRADAELRHVCVDDGEERLVVAATTAS